MGVTRLLTLLCVASSVLCNTPGTDRPDITMLYKGDNKVCVAGGNTQGHGLAFMSKNIRDDVYIDKFEYRDENGNAIDARTNCDMNEGDACSREWVTDKLKLRSSGTDAMAPITDERWNKFSMYRTRNFGPFFEHNYDQRYIIPNNFFVSFSIRSPQDAQILLCSTQNPKSESCYWILIDAFEHKNITGIRKCVKGVPNTFLKDDTECYMLRNETTIKLLNESKWIHFILSRIRNNLIRLWSWDINTGARELLTYYDVTPLSLSYMYVRSFNTIADWKMHTYTYLATTYPINSALPLGPQLNYASSSICISFYVIMCRKCKMEISLEAEDGVEIARSSIEGNPDEEIMTWRYVKMQAILLNINRNIIIYSTLSTTDALYTNPFWAIDDFRRCANNEIRVASININKEVTCQSLKYHDWTFNPDTPLSSISIESPICSDDRYIGLHCNISCSVPGQFQCSNNYKICLATREENGNGACTCAPGNKWTKYNECTQTCSYGIKYGYNCNKSCGKCKNQKCNLATGECEDGCEYGFQPPYCHNNTSPETPELDGNVTVDREKVTNTTVTLSIPGVKTYTRSHTSFFLYVTVSTPAKSITKKQIGQNIVKQEIIKRIGSNNNYWIAIESDLNEEEITVVVGDGNISYSKNLEQIINNKPLEPGSEYIITVLIMNQYKDKISSIHYTTYVKTVANESSGLYSLLLLLLLPVVGYFIYRYLKKKIVNPNPIDPTYYIEPNEPVRHSYLEVLDNPINKENNTEKLSENEYESVDHLQTSPNSTSEDHVYEAMDNFDKPPTYLNLREKERALMNSQIYANL